MKIVIIGAGSVGSAICLQLAGEGHDLTIVDTDHAILTELSNTCDVFGVVGNGADVSVLRRAGAERADLLIAVTSGDEINILSCAAARKLGTAHTIARVRNPEYSGLMQLMKSEMNLSLTINPELAVAKQIYRMLRSPSAAKIDTFCRGRVELAEFVVSTDSILCGTTLNDLRAKINVRFLVCSVLRDGKAYIPSGLFRIEAGDVVCVTAPEDDLPLFFKALGIYRDPVRNVLIVGGGRTTYYLLSMLGRSKIRTTVIERNKHLCRELAEQYGCTVICDNGTKQDLLREEGIENTDAFLALSSVDEENAIVSMYAKTVAKGKIVTNINAMSYIDLFKGVGLESIVSPQAATATDIIRYVRSMANAREASEIESLHRFMENRVEALEFNVKRNIDGITDIPLKKLRPRAGVLIACIVRRDRVIIPSGDDEIRSGDAVIIVTTQGQLKGLGGILNR
jgi:trk system potassium uptake protein TrkA